MQIHRTDRYRRAGIRTTNCPSSAGAVIAIVIATLTAGCTSDDPEPPTAVELAGMLIDTQTFTGVLDEASAGSWTLNVPPDQPQIASGIVTEEMRELLPEIELCPAATDEARESAGSLRWTAYRQLDLTGTDPIGPPGDRSGILMIIEEAGAWAEWRIHQVLVRDGPILALFNIVDIRADAAPLFGDDDLDSMLRLMADRLDG